MGSGQVQTAASHEDEDDEALTVPCWLRDADGSLATVEEQAAWVGMEQIHRTALERDDDVTLLSVEHVLRRLCRRQRDAVITGT